MACENGHHDFQFKGVIGDESHRSEYYRCKNCPATMTIRIPLVNEEIPRWRTEKHV